MKELIEIQKGLKAPKSQKNHFGKYNYRSCEDILEAVKPLLGNAYLTLSDDIINVGDRIYVKATATLKVNDGQAVSVTAMAREALSQKGMSDPQVTGSASSYARKYALNGLFAIDDTKDDDATNQHDKPLPPAAKPSYQKPVQQAPAPTPPPIDIITPAQQKRLMTIANGVPNDTVKDIIKHHGFTSSKLVTTFAYTQICMDIEAVKKSLEAK